MLSIALHPAQRDELECIENLMGSSRNPRFTSKTHSIAPLCKIRCTLGVTLTLWLTGSMATPVPMKTGIVVMNSCCNSPDSAK